MRAFINATAKVQVTVEVDAASWGGDVTVNQLLEQAGREGVQRVVNALKAANHRCVVIGEPKVVGVIAREERV